MYAAQLRQRNRSGSGDMYVGAVVFPFFLALVEDLEKEHPGKLANALGIAVDAVVLAHDVLDGLDGAAEIHLVRLLSFGLRQ